MYVATATATVTSRSSRQQQQQQDDDKQHRQQQNSNNKNMSNSIGINYYKNVRSAMLTSKRIKKKDFSSINNSCTHFRFKTEKNRGIPEKNNTESNQNRKKSERFSDQRQ